jgi:hypothetical protein
MILIIARFGRFLARKNDGNPDAEALWRGLQRLRDFAEGINATFQAYKVKIGIVFVDRSFIITRLERPYAEGIFIN